MIHRSAIVEDGAKIAASAEIGPFCYIGAHVEIGPDCKIGPNAVVKGHTRIGAGVRVFQFASVGEDPQDLKFSGEPGRLEIGENCKIREGVTIHVGTRDGGMLTRVGKNCLLMAYSHVAHDCVIGDSVIIANTSAVAGHVEVGDNTIISGLVGVHQFTKIGRHAFLAGGAIVTNDVMPFCFAQGDRAGLVGVNVEGLRRHGFDETRIKAIRDAYKTLFRKKFNKDEALTQLQQKYIDGTDKAQADVAEMIAFANKSERGLCMARRKPATG